LLAINVLVWLAMTAAGGSTDSEVLLGFGAKYGPAIYRGEYWRLFTAMFLHIGLMHLGFNSYALYVLGPETERFFGRKRFLTAYMLAGVLSIVVSYVFSSTLSAGASGAIFGLVGALAAFFIRQRAAFGEPGRRRLIHLVSIVGINLVIGFTVTGVDNWAHIGGLAAGFLIGWALSPEYEVVPASPSQPARVVDRNSLARRWWVLPVALLLTVGLILLGNVRQRSTAGAYQQRGEDHLVRGEWEEAIQEFSVVLEREPESWLVYLYRSEAYLRKGEHHAALQDLDRVIASRPAATYLTVAYTNRGRVHMLLGDQYRALIDLNVAVNLGPSDAHAHFVRGMIQIELGHWEFGVADLERALALGLDDDQSIMAARQVLDAWKCGPAGCR
jgi:rhomboid protease GluP